MSAHATAHGHAHAPPERAPVREERVYVWDRVVRGTHWTIALAMVVLFVTGILIGHPLFVVPGAAGDHFVTGTVKVVHVYAAIAFSLAVFLRIVWLFIGPKYARWSELIPTTRERVKNLFKTLKFYALIRKRIPVYAGHNPLAGAAYAVIFSLFLVQIATGFGLYSFDAAAGSPMRAFGFLLGVFGGPQSSRWIHHVTTWLLVLFAMQHVYSCLLASRNERNGELDSIFSGYKHVQKDEERDA